MITAYERTSRDGHKLNYRTLEMLLIAERRWAKWAGLTGCEFVLSQGSYNPGVSASGGTHDGGGALDVDATSWDTAADRDRIVLELRRIGFAAWYRPRLYRSDGSLLWNPHIHAIAIGDRELSPAAADQIVDYYAGRNGLADNGPDTGPTVEFTVYPQQLQELGMEPKDVWGYPLAVPGSTKQVSAGGMVRTTYGNMSKLVARVGALEAIVAKLIDTLEGTAGAPTLEQLTAAARKGAAQALTAGIDIHVDVDDQEPAPIPPPATP